MTSAKHWLAGALVSVALGGVLAAPVGVSEPTGRYKEAAGRGEFAEVSPFESSAEAVSLQLPASQIPVLDVGVLQTNALLQNPEAVKLLTSSPLNARTFEKNPMLVMQLRDPGARVTLQHIVSCALTPRQTLQVRDLASGTRYEYAGSAGLCPGWADIGGSASYACQEWVSACLLTRTTSVGLRVPMSLRGEHEYPAVLATGGSVRPFSFARAAGGSQAQPPVASLDPCSSQAGGVSRNCGWRAEFVGWCAAGTPVTVGAGCKGLGSAGVDPMIRVCDGVHACDHGSPSVVAEVEDSVECGRAPLTVFACPTSGYFGVMTAEYLQLVPPSANLAGVSIVGAGRYPAPEGNTIHDGAVFTWREGGFYGNLFGAEQLSRERLARPISVDSMGRLMNADVPLSSTPFLHAYACMSNAWNSPQNYYLQRSCGGDSSRCAAKYQGLCASVCRVQDGARVKGDFDFGACVGDGVAWKRPITTFLNSACDAIGRGEGCAVSMSLTRGM